MTTQTVKGEVLDLDTAVAKADEPQPAAPPAAPLKEVTRRFALIDAFKSALDDYVKSERPHMLARLLDAAEDTDSKSFSVKIDGETVATMTITDPSDKIVVDDEDALVDYVLENHPDEVETITRVRESFEKALLKRAEHTEAGIVDTATGGVVPGLKHVPAPPPSSFSTRWKGRAQKEAALDGLMDQVAPLLGIEAGEGDQ